MMTEKLIRTLAKSPWVLRQVTKATGYVGGIVAALLAQVQVTVDGKTVDVLPAQTEAAIVAAVVAALAAGLEFVMSYATAKVAKADAAPEVRTHDDDETDGPWEPLR